MKIRKAVIPVAGLGTRFLPATKVVPKELLPVVDKPAIQYIVEELASSGIEEIILVTGQGKNAILDYFNRDPELEKILQERNKTELLEILFRLSKLAHFSTVLQPSPLGLGHAILCAEEVMGQEPFIVCLPDDLIDSKQSCVSQMLQVYAEFKKPLIAVQEVPLDQVHQYGILNAAPLRPRIHLISDLVEKPSIEKAPSHLGIVGRYLLPPQIFSILKQVKPGSGGEIQLTDALRLLAREEKVYGFEFEGVRYDTGDKLGFLKANLAYGLKRQEFHDNLKEFLTTLV